MADTSLSKYIQQKRERDVFTDPAFDRPIEPSSEPAMPTKGFDMLEVPKYTPPAGAAGGSQIKPKIGSVQKAILARKIRNSGLTGKEADAAMSIAETQDGGARFIDINAPAGQSTVYSESMPPADIWSSVAAGFHNTFVSAGAGTKQLMLGWDGSKEDVEKIRQWQNENEVQVAKSTKRMLADSEMNWTKFGFGVGNAVGSVAVSVAPALALAPFGVGIVAGAAIGTAASYPMIFNSTFNSAIEAGYSPEEAATYAHMISIPISAVEFVPVAKLGRTLTTKTVGGIVENAIGKYLPRVAGKDRAISAITSKVAKSGISDDVLVNVYRSVNNGIKDRLLVNGGVSVANAATEGFTEAIQNYMERVGEVGYDNFKNKKNGEGFGTTMDDVTSMKQFLEASVDGMYGAIAGGGASIMSIGKPLYEQGIYNTLAKYDSKGRLDEGIQALTSALQAKVDAGNLDTMVAKQAITSISQVAGSYKKLGSGIEDPRIKAAMYYGVRKKDMLTEEISMLEKKKQEIEQKIGTGEIDPDIAKFDDDQINGLIALKNKQFAFTSEWLKETASQIYANKLNSVKGEVANAETDMDNLASDANQVKEGQSTWRKAMGFTPQFASVRVGELAKNLKGIQAEYEATSRIYGDESLKDKNLVTEFDEFESATKIIVDKGDNGIPTTSKGKFVSDGDGNYAVTLEQIDADGKVTKAYRPIPKTEYYRKRLEDIFSANKQFTPIAEKMLKGQKLTDDEAKIADDFDVDIQEIFQKKKQASDKKVDDLVENIVYSDDPLSQGIVDDSNVEDFEKQGVMDKISQLKIVAPSVKKFLNNGNSSALKSVIAKNQKVGNILQKLSEDETVLDRFLKNNPVEKKGKKKKGVSQPASQDAAGTDILTDEEYRKLAEAQEHEQHLLDLEMDAYADESAAQFEEQEADDDAMRRAENLTKQAELKEEIADYLQRNDTTTTQDNSGKAETERPQPSAQLGGANIQPALRAAIETTNVAVETLASDRELVEQVLSEDDTQDSAISELERKLEEVNRQADEIYDQQPSNQGGPASTPEKQESSSSQQGPAQTSEVVSDDLTEIIRQTDEPIKKIYEEYEANDRLHSKELRDFVDTFKDVFNIKIDVISGRVWDSLGLRAKGKAVFIGSEGKVILRSDSTKGDVLHELGHVAVASIKKSAPALYNRALESIRGTVYEEMVRKEYPNLSTDEEVLREALGWAIQDKGESILNGEGSVEQKKSLFDKITDYIKRIFRSLAEKIGLSVSPEFNLGDITLDQFSSEIASKILSGQKFESIFDNVINEYQPDPTDPDEYSLYGGHTPVAHQVSKMPSTSQGVMVTPEVMYSLKNFISDLQSGRTQNLTTQLISDAIKGPFEAIINSPKNQKHKWTKLTSQDLSSPFANYMYMELATGGGVQSKAGQDLLKELNTLSKKYSDWVRDSHVRVIDVSSGKPVESYSYIDHVAESKLANDKVDELKAANKGFFGKINQFFLSNYFTDLFNIETVSEFLGGQKGVLSGIHGLIRKRNTDAAIFAKYSHRDIEAYKKNLESVFGLKTADDYFQRKVSISAFNNMDGNPTDVTVDIPLGMAADIYMNYKTQSLNSPTGEDPTHSSIYYDKNIAGRGATDVRGKDVIYRGITQTIQDNEYNLLFDASQIAQLESMFGTGSTYEFMIKDAFDFYSGSAGSKSRFDMVNSVYINVKGESLRRIPNGTYAPTRAYSEGSNASHRTIGAAYDDVSFIKPRTDLPSRLQGSRDVLSAMEGYSQRAQNFIRNAEAAESLLVYERRVKDRWNNKEMQSKLDWLKKYRRDLNSYEQDRIVKGIEESRLGIPLVSYRTIMSNFAKSVFAFNLANPPKQGAGYLGAYGLGIIENKYLNKYRGFVTKSIRQSYIGYFGADEGKFLGTNISLSFDEEIKLLREIESYDEMSDIWLRLEDITSNTQGVPVQDIYSAYNSGQKGAAMKQFLGEKWDTITKYGLSPMRHSDRAPILGFYLAAKEQVSDMAKAGRLLDANGNPVVFSTTVNGVETLSPEAIQLVADKVTEITYRTNNMYMSNDKTGLQRSHGFFHETIGLFSSQPQKIFNLFLGNLFRAARSNFSDESINNTALSTFGYSVVTSAAMTAAITVAYSVMKNGGLDDDDDLKRDFLVETAKNIIGIAPSGGTELLMSILSMYDTRSSVDASGQNPVFEQMTRVVVGLSAFKDSFDAKTEESKDRLEKKAMSSVTSGFGSMVGVPSTFIRVLNSELLK